MKFHEKLDHKLREYQYRRKRNASRNPDSKQFAIEEFLDEVDAYVGEVIEEVDRFLPKK